jgi:hypothetical protein
MSETSAIISSHPFLSQELTIARKILVHLSNVISFWKPIEDWINTVSFLIERCFIDFPKNAKLHPVIHSICLACTSPSHVESLVEEGIFGYWERVLQSGEGGVGREAGSDLRIYEAITHLTSIDKELSSRIGIARMLSNVIHCEVERS